MRRKRKELYLDRERMYSIQSEPGVGHTITVLCGGVAMYERTVLLTQEDVAFFQSRGNLDELAFRIAEGELTEREV